MTGILNNIFFLALQLAIPITLGALCGTIAERSGVILLGVEGIMLIGAFAGVYGSYATGNAWLGVLFSIIIGGLVGLTYALFALKFKAHQSVVGVGVNMAGSGITAVLLKVVWNTEGMSTPVKAVRSITVPVLNKIPLIGGLFRNQTPYLYMMFIIVALIWVVFYRTKIGLRIRAIGDNPYAVQAAGINVNKYRYFALTIAGSIAGLAGSFLSISYNNLFVTDMVAGRGFMGLTANIFGGWNPLGAFGASLVFAVAQAIRFYLVDFKIPTHIVSMFPYLVTLIVLLVVGKRARAPEGLGKLVD